MHEGTITDFLALVGSNPDLQRELAKLATKYDFRFTDSPLSEEELSAVSGGLGETTRDSRQSTTSAFQDADQKSAQLYNVLSSVLKSMKDTQAGITSNVK